MASPNPAPKGELESVDASSATNIWAVGGNGGRAITERWDGHQWTAVANPVVGKGNVDLLESVSVLSPGNVWAVGLQSDTTGREALIEHWNGTRWAAVKTPVPGSRSNPRGVDVVSASNIWAVGSIFAPSTGSLRLHWDGTAWHKSSVLPDAAALFGIGGPAGNVWGVGDRQTTNGGFAAQVKGGCPEPGCAEGTAGTAAPGPVPLSVLSRRRPPVGGRRRDTPLMPGSLWLGRDESAGAVHRR